MIYRQLLSDIIMAFTLKFTVKCAEATVVSSFQISISSLPDDKNL